MECLHLRESMHPLANSPRRVFPPEAVLSRPPCGLQLPCVEHRRPLAVAAFRGTIGGTQPIHEDGRVGAASSGLIWSFHMRLRCTGKNRKT